VHFKLKTTPLGFPVLENNASLPKLFEAILEWGCPEAWTGKFPPFTLKSHPDLTLRTFEVMHYKTVNFL
jgi:hypothetical protein